MLMLFHNSWISSKKLQTTFLLITTINSGQNTKISWGLWRGNKSGRFWKEVVTKKKGILLCSFAVPMDLTKWEVTKLLIIWEKSCYLYVPKSREWSQKPEIMKSERKLWKRDPNMGITKLYKLCPGLILELWMLGESYQQIIQREKN